MLLEAVASKLLASFIISSASSKLCAAGFFDSFNCAINCFHALVSDSCSSGWFAAAAPLQASASICWRMACSDEIFLGSVGWGVGVLVIIGGGGLIVFCSAAITFVAAAV